MPDPFPTVAPHLDLWLELRHELMAHHTAHLAVLVSLAVLLLGRLVLRPAVWWRLRFPAGAFVLYAITLPLRGFLAAHGLAPEYVAVAVGATILLALGFIGTSEVIVFDFVGYRLRRMRILRDVVTMVAAVVASILILSRAGVNLVSLITTSAVLSVVLGLALQDTLGNVLAGIAVQLESTISPGDWVNVGDINGRVSEIRWRSTIIITRNDDMVVVPHALLAKSIIVNHSRPVGWQRRWVDFDVHYRHPPNLVQRTVLEALAGLPAVKHDQPAPDCVLMRMEQDHAHYAVRYRLLDLAHDDGTDSEVRKRIWYALRRNGIEIPYPSRNVFVTELNKEREQTKSAREHEERTASLRRIDLFLPLDGPEVDLLAERMRVELFGDGERVIEQGCPGDSLYLIRRGMVGIRVEVEGTEREVATLGAGDFFGEMSLITGEPRHATVVARGDVECYVIDRALFQQVLAGRQSLVHEITRLLVARQSALAGQVKELGEVAARLRAESHQDLVERIKRLFGLGDNETAEGG